MRKLIGAIISVVISCLVAGIPTYFLGNAEVLDGGVIWIAFLVVFIPMLYLCNHLSNYIFRGDDAL